MIAFWFAMALFSSLAAIGALIEKFTGLAFVLIFAASAYIFFAVDLLVK